DVTFVAARAAIVLPHRDTHRAGLVRLDPDAARQTCRDTITAQHQWRPIVERCPLPTRFGVYPDDSAAAFIGHRSSHGGPLGQSCSRLLGGPDEKLIEVLPGTSEPVGR